MAPPRQVAGSSSDQTATDTVFRKFCSAIVEPGKQGRFKSLLNRDNRKIVCQLKSYTIGLNLLQIAVLLDDVATGRPGSLPSCCVLTCIQSNCGKKSCLAVLTCVQGVKHMQHAPLSYQKGC